MNFINILETVISEQKRFRFDPETYTRLMGLTDKLWSNRNKQYDRKTKVDQLQFKTSDGILKMYAPGMDTAQPFRDFASDLEAHALTEGRTLDRLRADLAYETEEREGWQGEAIEADLCAVEAETRAREAETRLAMVGGKGSHTRAA